MNTQNDKGRPETDKLYVLVGGTDTPSIANGNTWAESEISKEEAYPKHDPRPEPVRLEADEKTLNSRILRESWGYNMTMNDYALVLEDTGKTVKCVMIGHKIAGDNGMGNGHSVPDVNNVISEPFRLRKTEYGYNGSYEFCPGSKRFGRFSEWDGKADYYNTWD